MATLPHPAVTDEAPTPDVSLVLRYCTDPAFRAQMDAERDAVMAKINADFDARRRSDQERLWAREVL